MNIFLCVCMILFSTTQCAVPFFESFLTSGLEVVSFPSSFPVSYAANFRMDPTSSLAFFTSSDKYSPNLYAADLGSPKMVVLNTNFNLTIPSIMAMDNTLKSVIAIGLPAWDTGANTINIYTFKLINSGSNYSSVNGDIFSLPGYTPANIIYDTTLYTDQPFLPAYVCGYGANGFYVMALYLNETNLQFNNFNQNLDIFLLQNFLPDNYCFDLYDALNKPSMWIDENSKGKKNLVIVLEGRCGLVIILPLTWTKANQAPFGTPIIHPTFELNDIDSAYVAASAFQPSTPTLPGKLFYLIQNYNRTVQPLLISYNIETAEEGGSFLANIPAGGWSSHIQMVWANYSLNNGDSNIIGLFMFPSGSYLAYLFSTDEWMPGSLGMLAGVANIPTKYNAISSLFYFQNYLYFTVYTATSSVARISTLNFCLVDCGIYAYCNAGVCACQDPYQLTVNVTTNSSYCENPVELNIKNKEIQDQVGIVFFSIITACVVFIGMVGWASWWKGRRQ